MLDLNTISVLIVDDMESMRRTIRSMLKGLKIGRTILHAPNGRDAWRILTDEDTSIDLAIIDWNMPIMNGIQLLNRIRNSDDFRDMPVIMITAETEKDIIIEAAESDIDGYLLKPLTIKLLDETLRKVVKMANDPPPARKHFLNARNLEEEGDIDGAIEEIRLALKGGSSSSRILRKLGLLYLEKDHVEIAEKCLCKAVAVSKYDAISRYHLGELYLKKNDLKNALKYYDQAISLGPRNISKGVINLGSLLIHQGMNDKAVEIFDKMIKHSDDFLRDSEQIADVCLQNGEYQYARDLLSRIIKDEPQRYDLVFKAGVAYEKSGDADSALMHYRTVDEKVRDNIEVKLHLAKIYIDKRKILMADDLLNQILAIDPEHEEARELRAQI